jgi:hypothetical protein
MLKKGDSDSNYERSNISMSSDKDITPTSLNKSITMKYIKEIRPNDSMGYTSMDKTNISDKSFQSRMRSISRVYSDKSFEKRKSTHSQNDSKSFINDADMSLNDSCMEELATLQEFKSYDRGHNHDISDDDVSFTRILEVDEEYVGSNCNTGRDHHSSQESKIQIISPKELRNHLMAIPESVKKPTHMAHKSMLLATPSTCDKSSEKMATKSSTTAKTDMSDVVQVKDREGKKSIDIPKLNLFKLPQQQ